MKPQDHVIENAIDQLVEKEANPRTAYMHDVLDAIGYSAKFVDPTSRGYRVKLFSLQHKYLPKDNETDDAYHARLGRLASQWIDKMREQLNRLGYHDVEPVIRGSMYKFASLIIPYSK